MSIYAVVRPDGRIVNRVVLNAADVASWISQNGEVLVVDGSNAFAIGGTYINSVYTPPSEIPESPTEAQRRLRRDALAADTIRADLLDKLQTMTPAQIKTYVTNNVTDLATSKTLLAKILLILSIP